MVWKVAVARFVWHSWLRSLCWVAVGWVAAATAEEGKTDVVAVDVEPVLEASGLKFALEELFEAPAVEVEGDSQQQQDVELAVLGERSELVAVEFHLLFAVVK